MAPAPNNSKPTADELADLSALADGTLDPAREAKSRRGSLPRRS